MLIKAAKYTLKVVPDSIGISITRALAAMTQRPPVSAQEREAMAQATKLYYGDGNVAWSWGKEGPLLILIHGWGGRAAQMAPLATHLVRQGFRAVALDITGHGDSPKRHTRWAYFVQDIAALTRSLNEDVYAYVAHSAGALSMMAARNLKGLRARRYVCICAPSHPFPPINVIEKKLSPSKGVVERYKREIAAQFETVWEQLQTGSSYANVGPEMLLFYDETDRFVPHGEGDKIHALCPGSRLIKTNAYSHLKILTAPELAEAVGAFLSEDRVGRLSA
jgi:pimeloyl-ACP methyl ester carboxylesterase